VVDFPPQAVVAKDRTSSRQRTIEKRFFKDMVLPPLRFSMIMAQRRLQ
jgi:hypothetical protein